MGAGRARADGKSRSLSSLGMTNGGGVARADGKSRSLASLGMTTPGVGDAGCVLSSDGRLFGREEAVGNLRQHGLDGERVVGGVRHDGELVCGPQ